MAHRRAKLTALGRRLLVDRIVMDGMAVAHAADMAGVSRQTAWKWLRRFEAEGEAGLVDRTSRPHRSPRALAQEQVDAILAARHAHRFGPHRLGIPRREPALDDRRRALPTWPVASRRYGPTLGSPDPVRPRTAGRAAPHRRQEAGTDPHGGGHRFLGRITGTPRSHGAGYDYLHVAIDDMSRVALRAAIPRRARHHMRPLPARRGGVLRRSRGAYRTSPDRQRQELHRVPGVRRDPGGDRRPPQADPALPTRRPTANPNGSTAPCSTSGRTRGPAPRTTSAWRHSTPGFDHYNNGPTARFTLRPHPDERPRQQRVRESHLEQSERAVPGSPPRQATPGGVSRLRADAANARCANSRSAGKVRRPRASSRPKNAASWKIGSRRTSPPTRHPTNQSTTFRFQRPSGAGDPRRVEPSRSPTSISSPVSSSTSRRAVSSGASPGSRCDSRTRC